MPNNLKSSNSGKLKGRVKVPGDKSISHRALLLSSQAIGTSKITGLLEGEDVIATANALRSMSVKISSDDGVWAVEGVGVGGLAKSDKIIDFGNSGTGVRLMMGLVASYPFTTSFTGDKSLCSRPMARVTTPLEKMGVHFESEGGVKLPISVIGNDEIMPVTYESPVASAQVKSAVLLAGLNTRGQTTVIEKVATRDHTERMLQGFGAKIDVIKNGSAREITITGHPDLKSMDIDVPGDPSSAAFLVVAALITPDSDIVIENICINPLRTGLYDTLIEMGADIKFTNKRLQAGEDVADIAVKYSKLRGITVPADRAPSMIDEYPILSVAAAYASGETRMEGLHELKVKESDRLQAVADGLAACGVTHQTGEDWLNVEGSNVKGGGLVETCMDHRIAMSFLIMGLASKLPISVDDGSMIDTSFPNFAELINEIGGKIEK